MKNSIMFLAMIASLALLTACKKTGEPGAMNDFHRYAFKNVHVIYKHNGDTRGREELFIGDYGKYEAHYSDIEVFREQAVTPRKFINITRNTDTYNIDFMNHQLRHQKNPMLDSLYSIPSSDLPATETFFSEQMKKSFFVEDGTDTIGGHTVTVWRQKENNNKLWIWKTIALKQYFGTQGGFISVDMVSIDTNWTMDSSKFAIPTEGFDVIEVKPGEPMQPMQQQQ